VIGSINIHPVALTRIFQEHAMAQQFIRIRELASTPGKPGKLPVSPATIWRWVREGKFPAPFKLHNGVTIWNLALVEAHIAQCAEETSK
jgi:predicted DNA-binding transcriptional regulator AlpA